MLLVQLDYLIEHKCSYYWYIYDIYISIWNTVLYNFFDVARTVSSAWMV